MPLKPIHTTLILALLTVPVLPGCDRTANLTEQEHVLRAKDHEDKGNLKAAVIELKNALQKNPDSAQARLLLGQVYAKNGLGAEAEKELRRARELGVAEESVKYAMGRSLLLQREYQRVLNEIRPGDQTTPRNRAGILQLRGEAMLGLRKLDEGCALYQQSLELDATHVPSYWGLARCAAAKNDLAGARAHLNAALKLNAKNATTWVLLGDLQRTQNDADGALKAYDAALSADPNDVSALTSRAAVALAAGKLDVVRKDIGTLRKLAPNDLQGLYLQALLDHREKRHEAAWDGIQQILRGDPTHVPSLLLSGSIALALGQYQQAEANLAKALATLPNVPEIRKLLASAQLKLGEPQRALETLKPLLSPGRDVESLALAGEASMLAQNYQEAFEYFEKAARMDQNSAALRTALGRSQLALGQTDVAIREFQAAAAMDPKNPRPDLILALTYLNGRDFDKALAAVSALEKKLPNQAIVFNLKGLAYVGKKDFPTARKAFEKALELSPAFLAAATNLARLDHQDRNPQAARKRFEAVLAHDKKNFTAMMALADLSLGAGSEAGYVEWMRKAIGADASALAPRLGLSEYFLRKRDLEKALALAQEARVAAPEHPAALDLLGRVQSASGDRNGAVSTFTRWTILQPASALAFLRLGGAQWAAGDAKQARESFNKSLALYPQSLDAKLALAALETAVGRPEQARNIAREIQRAHPKSPAGHILEGEVWMAQKKYPEAAKSFEAALQIKQDGALSVQSHLAQLKSGKAREADGMILRWLEQHPKDRLARLYLGESYMQRNRNQDAIRQYQTVLQDDPNNTAALNNLANLLYREKNLPSALEYAERAYKTRSDDVAVADTLGWILSEMGNAPRAVELLQKAASLAPANPTVRYHLASALFKSGNRAQARKELDAALRSGKPFPEIDAARSLAQQL